MAKINTPFMRLKNHTLWRRTYLYSPYKGVPPPPPPGDSSWLHPQSQKVKPHYNIQALTLVGEELTNICSPESSKDSFVISFCSPH